MNKNKSFLIITHIAYRANKSNIPIEGPYSSIAKALLELYSNVNLLGLPLFDDNLHVLHGKSDLLRSFKLPEFLGKYFFKYITDFIVTFFYIISWCSAQNYNNKIIIAIDPLSALPALLLRGFFRYKIIYHCVDFNKNRFNNHTLQFFYEKSDEIATKKSDQAWVICQSLHDYKEEKFHVKTFYVPNSVIYDPSISNTGFHKRNGKKMIWTGGLMTVRQYKILFGTLKVIQEKVRSDIEFVIAPTKDFEKIADYIKKYQLKHAKLLKLNSRLEFQKIASTCDVGIALYDEKFGSTEYIEPMKVWDFMLCGLPFIVSHEPSISAPILRSGVVYRLLPKNKIPNDNSLKIFLQADNLQNKFEASKKIARTFDIKHVLKKQIALLNL